MNQTDKENSKKRYQLLCPYCGAMMVIELTLPETGATISSGAESTSSTSGSETALLSGKEESAMPKDRRINIVSGCPRCKKKFTVDLREMGKHEEQLIIRR